MIRTRFRTAASTAAVAGSLVSLLSTAAPTHAQQADSFALHDGDRVVFYGDSITDQRQYTNFVEYYVVTRFPTMNVRFTHSGWGGDRVGGGGGGPIDLRLQRDVLPYKPTVMTIMLGMNDASYRAFDQGIFDTYTRGYTHILNTVKKALPDVRFTLIQPSPYDDVTRAPGFPDGYNSVLVRYGNWIKETAEKEHQRVADLNTSTVAMLTKANATDSALAQKIIPDRVHPGPGGHLIMAAALLKAWNAPALVSRVSVDAGKKTVGQADNAKVSGLTKTGDSISWDQLDSALPMIVDPGDPVVALAIKSSDVTESLNQEPLKVTGLTPDKRYTLTIDGREVGDFTGAEWAQGINLATLPTPMAQQAMQVLSLTRQHNDEHFRRWRELQVPYSTHSPAVQQALPPLLAALDAEEEQTVLKQRAAAQPKSHRFEIGPALPPPAGVNLALNKPYEVSDPNRYNYGPGGLTDGSFSGEAPHTFATGDTDVFPKTATINLGTTASINAVIVGMPAFGSTKTVEVSVSTDGQKFTKVGSYVFSLRHEEKHTYRFAATNARYIRLTYPDHYDEEVGYNRAFSFTSEVEVYAAKP
ncbi:MAG: GDSL-type esterase/lipase family protein [Armatimonas sp.]